MMTPRGVADVHVYTPERVELRYGVRPDQVPDFIGLKGDTSDNIPGIPGIGDKTAGQLIAQYGSLEEVIEHAGRALARARQERSPSTPTRRARRRSSRRCGATSPLDVDPATLVSAPPDRSQLKEIFRRFEFRGLLDRVDTLDEALPAPERRRSSRARPSPGARSSLGADRAAAVGVATGTAAIARRRRTTASWSRDRGLDDLGRAAPRRRGRRSRREGAAPRPYAPADDTLLAAYLIDPAARSTRSTTSPPSTASSSSPSRPRRRRPRASSAHAEARAAARAAAARAAASSAAREQLYDEIELPLTAVLAAMEDAGVRIDTYRMGEITARLADRVEELEARATELAGEAFLLGSTQQVARILFEKLGLDAGPQGQDGLLDRHAACSARSATSTRSCR